MTYFVDKKVTSAGISDSVSLEQQLQHKLCETGGQQERLISQQVAGLEQAPASVNGISVAEAESEAAVGDTAGDKCS